MTKSPIFIHSLFRTGSTYIWSRFRSVGTLCCFYEPFHPELRKISMESPDPWRHDAGATIWMHHPRLAEPYLKEYFPLLRAGIPGVPHFRKSFSFDDFCRKEDSPHQKHYLNSLIAQAGEKRAVLQFNRTALRTRWFRKEYPRALQIYLVRNPDHQFCSQQSLFQTLGLDTFQVMDFMAVSLNRDAPEFLPLAKVLPLPRYEHGDFSVQRRFFSRVGSALSLRERYFLFYYLWFSCLVENLAVSADILSIDELSSDEDYRRAVEERLSAFVSEKIDFSDAAVRQYEARTLPENESSALRVAAQALVLGRVDRAEVIGKIQTLSPRVRKSLVLDRDLPEAAPGAGDFTVPFLRPVQEIRDAFSEVLGGDMERKFQESRLLRGILKKGDPADPVAAQGSLADQISGSQTLPLSLHEERIYDLEEELRRVERKSRVQEDEWKRRIEDLEKIIEDLTTALDQRKKMVTLAENERDTARMNAEKTQKSLDLAVRDLNHCRSDAEWIRKSVEDCRSELDELREKMLAIRVSRWYRWSKKLHFLKDSK